MKPTDTVIFLEESWRNESLEASSGNPFDEELVVTAFHDPPYFFINRQEDGSFSYDGYIYELWKILAGQLHLNYRIVPLLNGSFGHVDGNGTWNGMVGELAYGRADVALSWIGMTRETALVVDWADAVPLGSYHIKFLVNSESAGVPEIGLTMFHPLLKPLDSHVWWMLAAALLVMSVALWTSHRVNRTFSEKTAGYKMNWASSLFYCFLSMLRQGWEATPHSLSARIMVLTIWFMSIIINISYTANLISCATVSVAHLPIANLEEFLQQPDWTFAGPGIEWLNDWALSDNIYERRLHQLLLKGDRSFEASFVEEDRRVLLLQPKVLLFTDLNQMRYAIGSAGCGMVPLNDPGLLGHPRRGYLAFAKRRRALRTAVNELLLKMRERGLISRLQRRWPPEGPERCGSSTSVRLQTFGDLLAILTLVPLAVMFSAGLLCLERVWPSLGTPPVVDRCRHILVTSQPEPFTASRATQGI